MNIHETDWKVPPGSLPAIVPLWLEQELVYANRKHKGNNPQLAALNGGLAPGGLGYQDFTNYQSRFLYFAEAADGSERIMLARVASAW